MRKSYTLETGFRTRPLPGSGTRARVSVVVVALSILFVVGVAWVRNGRSSVGVDSTLQMGAVGAVVAQSSSGGDVAPSQAITVAPVTGHVPQIRVEFERSDDLFAYMQSLEPAVRDGDADAMWMVSRVYDYCSGYAMAPSAFARDTQVIRDMAMRGSPAMVAARERIGRRCARFVPQDDLSPRMIVAKRVEAAEAGSLAAEASLMASGKPVKEGEAYVRDLVERVKESKDPDAYSALSPEMGIASSGRVALSDQVAGTQFSELAWQLAACRLGLDCGPQSSLMTSYCANGGICSTDPSQDFPSFVYDAAIPRQGVDVVNAMVDSLMREKRAGK
ncbi:hypothetical protein MNR01_08465 [Lysobacter sp. S4-A87]|uniref:hypothetical protein n=1 Tax=Lysobacter sp. S4-A87 TaxID=2925843 RepID=UPI001F52EA7E|nr:hypothetical protein [Lysobacter sp. S4-A87]UNK51010.1 hypothetical protein MNR01_08465 [Lysobacter sp. S4-A87]